MINLKKTTVTLLILGSSALSAGTMGPACVPGSVTIPCAQNAWDFGAQALYLRPSFSSDFVYFNESYFDTSTSSKENQVHTNWDWGFQIEASYHFSTGNDVNVNWYYYDVTNHSNFATDTGSVRTASVTPRWNAVNLEIGQLMSFDENKSFRYHAGVQFSQVKVSYFNTISLMFFLHRA